MSAFGNIPVTYHPLVNENISDNNNNQLKKTKTRKIILIFLCSIAILTLFAISISWFIKAKGQKSSFSGSTIISNFTSYATLSISTVASQLKTSIKVSTTTSPSIRIRISSENITKVNSSACHLPLYPMYNKFGTIVAGINDTHISELDNPSCVYLDSKQNIYVCDTNNYRIIRYSQNNPRQGVAIIGGKDFVGKGTSLGFRYNYNRNVKLPRKLYINHRNDDLYYLDFDENNNYRVQYIPYNLIEKNTPNILIEATVLLIGNKAAPLGMDLDQDLNIYISESHNHRVVKWLSPDYEQYLVVAGNGTDGQGLNQLSQPQGIYVDPLNNDLYIADAHGIQRWQSGSSVGQTVVRTGFFHPLDITRDCHGNFYVIAGDTIKLFSPSIKTTGLDGFLLVDVPTHIVRSGIYVITFNLALLQGMYLDTKNGDLYVADGKNNRIQKFSINGEFVPVNKVNSSSSQICHISSNRSWENHDITVAGNIIGCGSTNKRLCRPQDLFLDKNNTLFAVDTDNNRIQKYTSTDVITVASKGLYKPLSMYVDSLTGDMYILDSHFNDTMTVLYYQWNYRIQLWRVNSTRGTTIINGTGNSYSMDVDRYLNIYTVEYDHNRVKKWYAHTNYTVSIIVAGDKQSGPGIHQLLHPTGIYVDDETDTLYIIDSGNQRIVKWRYELEDDAITAELVVSDKIITDVTRLTLDCEKNIFLTVTRQNGLLYQFGIHTNYTLKNLGGDGGTWGRILRQPVGIKLDSFGNIFIAEKESHRIVKFSVTS